MQMEVINSAALLGSMLRDFGASYLSGKAIDFSSFQAMANSQRRLLEALGLERRAREVTSLEAHLAAKREAAE